MPKKGKGKKGKGDSSEKESQPNVQSQPGPSQAGTGRGRGRGRGRGAPETPGTRQDAPVGRGRGRDEPSRTQTPVSPGTSQAVPSGSFFKTEADKPKEMQKDKPAPKEEHVGETSRKKTVLPKDEQEKVISEIAGLSLEFKLPEAKREKFSPAKRPNYSLIKDINRIQLFVNYFKLQYKNDVVIYHYDIEISDSTKDKKVGKSVFADRTAKEDKKKNVKQVEREKRRNMGKAKCRQIISEFFQKDPIFRRYCPVYDGQKNLYTSERLPCKKDPIPIDVNFDGIQKTFFVKISPVEKQDGSNIISLEPLVDLYNRKSRDIPYEVLLVFETVMTHREPPFQQVQYRNSFFSLTDRPDQLGCGLEIWYGYHQNVQLTDLGPVVLINLAAKAFHKSGPVIDYASDVLQKDITRLPRLELREISVLSESLKGVQIKVTHQPHPRKYKIKAVTNESASTLMVDMENRSISVAQYFQQKYQRRLVYPHLPCLKMQTSTDKTFIPMEVCEIIKGQPKIGKLSAELTSKMIRGTAVAPQKRKDVVNKNAVSVNHISDRFMRAFGLLMDIKMIKVDGRIMAAPQLAYAENERKSHVTKPDIKGVWRMEEGRKFFKIVKIERWVLISFANDRSFGMPILSKYCEFLVKSAQKCGMQLNRPEYIEIYRRNVTTEEALMRAKKCNAQFAIVVLNRKDEYHKYEEVKFLADFKVNLVTQCMEDKTLLRINDQITTNVCLKINVKLGGINHILHQKLKIFSEPVTVLGIDAIHWPRGFGYPSIVSVVGSLNPTATRYALVCDTQANIKQDKISQEIIRDMKKLAGDMLDIFVNENNGRIPKKIIVFRDGVSEGQFQHALEYEVSGIQEASYSKFQAYIPITYIVVQKRHHTRFFPVNPSQGVGRNQNVPPGTCVDREITHPVFFDYFICSHEGIQGTSKPAHYTVLHDDLKFSSEELQELCYFLCHTFVRCTRSVSLPAPVMYADLAAARAKQYADLFIKADDMSVSSDDTQKNLPPNVVEAIKSMKSFRNNMFYI